jgi:hypothetical protein
MRRQSKYPAEVRERAVRLVFEQQPEHESQWDAIGSIATKMGCTAETAYKVWRQLRRERRWVARCTVERLMRQEACAWSCVHGDDDAGRRGSAARGPCEAKVFCYEAQPALGSGFHVCRDLGGLR